MQVPSQMDQFQVVCLSDGTMAAAPTSALTPLRLLSVKDDGHSNLSKSSSNATLAEKDLPTSTESRAVSPFFLGNWEAAGFPTFTSNCPSPTFYTKNVEDDKSRAESPHHPLFLESRATTPNSIFPIFASRSHSPSQGTPPVVGIPPSIISGNQYLLVPTSVFDSTSLIVPKVVTPERTISIDSELSTPSSNTSHNGGGPIRVSVAPSRSSAFRPTRGSDKEDDKDWEPRQEVVRERVVRPESQEQHAKPTASYARLIAQALLEAPDRKMRLRDIYAWFTDNYPYFRPNDSSWQNSVRHNLSLNKCFFNIPTEGTKGGYWSIDERSASSFESNGVIPPTRPQRRRAKRGKARNDSAVEVEWSQEGDGLAALAEAAARNV